MPAGSSVSNSLMQNRDALCHKPIAGPTARERANVVQIINICAYSVHFDTELLCLSGTVLAVLLFGAPPAFAQAPIQDRAEVVTGVAGARRSADTARAVVLRAQQHSDEAIKRVRVAQQALSAAQAELKAARADRAAASALLARARQTDAEAQAALAKALEKRNWNAAARRRGRACNVLD